ncbi:HAD-like domain-containing protein [Mycena belliarum]|uniref:HAD-like domain-containing protein n=1 Tax=Mycena belliarum TaxID=1033014 RepID=A0AAD6UG50_9AGAR|nr:HAD-like domain-containing protein [Mycena belliae]
MANLPPLHPAMSFNTLILDFNDVVAGATIGSSKQLKAALASRTWLDYETGRITQDACYRRLETEFSIPSADIHQALRKMRDSLRLNEHLIALIRQIKQEKRVKVISMSNISAPDYESLRSAYPELLSLFDHIFTSTSVGLRKPSLSFFRHVFAETCAEPGRTVFVDQDAQNILSARSLGMYGVISDGNLRRSLSNLFGDAVSRARLFLRDGAGHHHTVIENGITFHDNFSQLLILELTADRSLVHLVKQNGPWNFFQGPPVMTTASFPEDLDTTSLALTIMPPDACAVNSMMDEMLRYLTEDDIIGTYFDHSRPRFDPTVCVNVLSLFYSFNRGSELASTLYWVRDVLLNRAYVDGSRYYATGECFLYFLARLLQRAEDPALHSLLEPLLKQRIQEHIARPGDAVALSMRLIVCEYLGIENRIDLQSLLALQCEDGGWAIGPVYRYGVSGLKIGNRGLTTALAVKALELGERFAPSGI